MASINSPQLLWIDGRCHRINPTTDKVNVDIEMASNIPQTEYQEEDLYGEEEADIPDVEIEFVNNKFKSFAPVPSVLHSRIIGPKGTVRKRLEYETKCQVTIPRMGVEGPVEIVGLARDDVIRCRQRIDMILSSVKQKMKPTHFIGVPFGHSVEILGRFKEFTGSLQKYAMGGLVPEMIVSPQKLHVTFNTMVLLDDHDRAKATKLLKSFHEEFIKGDGRFKDISVAIQGLDSFQANKLSKCRVLYAQVKSEVLQELADSMYAYFIKHGLSFKEFGRDTVRMHMTLIKGSQGATFDCEDMFNELREFDFGTVTVTEIHLSQMSTVDPETGYYKATNVLSL